MVLRMMPTNKRAFPAKQKETKFIPQGVNLVSFCPLPNHRGQRITYYESQISVGVVGLAVVGVLDAVGAATSVATSFTPAIRPAIF